jgi:methyl-accepting chemotaxis protein
MKEMAKASELSSREIRSVANANQQHSKSTAKVTAQLADIRRITQRNAEGVSKTRGGTAELIEQARTLSGLMSPPARKTANGRNGAK